MPEYSYPKLPQYDSQNSLVMPVELVVEAALNVRPFPSMLSAKQFVLVDRAADEVALLDCDFVGDGVVMLKLEMEGNDVIPEVLMDDKEVETDGSEVTTEVLIEDSELDMEVLMEGNELEIDAKEVAAEVWIGAGAGIAGGAGGVTGEVGTCEGMGTAGREPIGGTLMADNELKSAESELARVSIGIEVGLIDRDMPVEAEREALSVVGVEVVIAGTGLAAKVGVVQTLKVSQPTSDVVHEV